MANFEIKTIKDVAEGIIAKYKVLRYKYNDYTPLLEKAAVKSLAWAFAGVLGNMWQALVWAYKQCFPQTCDLPVLKLWGGLVDVLYLDGQAATVELTINDATAAYLTTGTVYKDLTSGLIFKTTSQANNEDKTIIATAQCSTSGVAGNLSVGTILTIANPLDGIPQTARISKILIEGTEDEEVEQYRKRVLYKFRNKSQTGSMIDYYNWAMEVAGIVDVLPYVFDEGTITLYLVAEGEGKYRTPSGNLEPNPFPKWEQGQFSELTGSGQFLQVAQSIEGSSEGVHDRRPVQAKVELKAPEYMPLKVEITGLNDTSYSEAIRTAIMSELESKRPNIIVLGYGESMAKINSSQLSAIVNNVISPASFSTFELKDESDQKINDTTLKIGTLAYLAELTINGEIFYRG